MEKFEQKDFKKQILEKFVEKIEDLVTDPKYVNRGYDPLVIEKIKKGEKIKYDDRMGVLLIMVCQDFHLPPEETAKLKNEIFNLE